MGRLGTVSLSEAVWCCRVQGAAQQQKPPLVVMAHGLAGQKDMGLEPFAEAFVNHGLAVLLFDYRCFGGSDGEPRNWVGPRRHLQDWEAALAYARVRHKTLEKPYRNTLSEPWVPSRKLALRRGSGGWVAAVAYVQLFPSLDLLYRGPGGTCRTGRPRWRMRGCAPSCLHTTNVNPETLEVLNHRVFVLAGLVVLLFDYRCFGGSDGEPRNWVGPRRHLQDWEAALAYARVRHKTLKKPYRNPLSEPWVPSRKLALRGGSGGWVTPLAYARVGPSLRAPWLCGCGPNGGLGRDALDCMQLLPGAPEFDPGFRRVGGRAGLRAGVALTFNPISEPWVLPSELALRPGGWEAAPVPCCPTRATKRGKVGRGAGRLLHVHSCADKDELHGVHKLNWARYAGTASMLARQRVTCTPG